MLINERGSDDAKSIGQLVKETPGADVKRFARFQMGEA